MSATSLKDAFLEHRRLTFPDFPQDDAFADVVAELAELDGYVAGLASSTIHGASADTSTLDAHVREFRAQLDGLPPRFREPDDERIRREVSEYLVSLERLADLMLRQ